MDIRKPHDIFCKEKEDIAATYSQVPIKRVGPNKRVGWIFKYINFIKEYLGPNKRVEGKICYSSRVENENK